VNDSAAVIAAVASAVVAGIGLIFAGWQVRLLNQAARQERKVALDGVAVSWQPVEAPHRPEPDGTAQWVYRITAHNPGRLPIDEIVVRLTFPVEVRRVHYSGVRDEPCTTLTLTTPVLVGGGQREWTRRIEMDFAVAGERLSETNAEIHFRDVSGEPHTNPWPRRRPVRGGA
jgi:hypothetical protein